MNHQTVIAILEFKGELPEGQHMKVENKNFYFDIGQNSRGIYMRISEVIFYLFIHFCLFLFCPFVSFSFQNCHDEILCFLIVSVLN